MTKPHISFKLKIVLWYSLLVLLTLVLFRLVTVEVIRNTLYDDLDNSLHAEAKWVRGLLYTYKARNIPDEEMRGEIAERSRLSPRKEFIEILDDKDRIYFHSANIEAGELSAIKSDSNAVPTSILLSSGIEARLLSSRDSLYTIQIAYPLTDIDNALESIITSLLLLIPLALLLTVAGGYVLVNRFTQPIKELNIYADTLVRYPLHQELPKIPVEGRDELDMLVVKVTDLVGRMRNSLKQVLNFSSLASHELRTPLTIIRSQLEGALGSKDSAQALKQTIASTYDEVLRMNRIADDLLSIGTMQAGTFTLKKADVDLNAFLEDFKEDATLLAAKAGIAFEVHDGASLRMQIDATRMQQVLFNLLDNAIRHTPSGGRIALKSSHADNSIILIFSDTGEGIAPDSIEHIFDVFYRSESKKSGGAGLGLPLVKMIVEAHGGSVEVNSELGNGTTFRITLPAA